ncbi:MAG TPA: uracil-DNA glycosylase [Patescibacteria group bacterium]|nr:uracil-DNA glycosylase [Patescibacteria group bacterium]
MKKNKELKKIKDSVIACQRCLLSKQRKDNNYFPVIGQGDHSADILFCGEAPGRNEALTGRPFCGASGKILDELLAHAGIKRQDIYITNILKCRPPSNRNPQAKEIKVCSTYLKEQIKIIKPKVICTLGNFATKFIFANWGLEDKIQGISRIHGQVSDVPVEHKEKGADKIIALYHPAVATYNAKMKQTLKKDFEILKKFK